MVRVTILVVGAALACSCGGSSSTTPSTTPTATNTITITASGVSPKDIVVSAGSQVTFTNNDNRNHNVFVGASLEPLPPKNERLHIIVGALSA